MQYQADHQSDQPATELASPWIRLVAVIIDFLIYVGVSIVSIILGLLLFPGVRSDDSGTELGLGFIIFVVGAAIVIFIVQMALLGTRGQTIGKIAMKVRVVDAQTGAHPGWPRLVLLRTIVNGIITGILFIYWIVDSLFIFRGDHRTIHDLYSGTRVDKV